MDCRWSGNMGSRICFNLFSEDFSTPIGMRKGASFQSFKLFMRDISVVLFADDWFLFFEILFLTGEILIFGSSTSSGLAKMYACISG